MGMSNNESCSCKENSPRNQIFSPGPCAICNCDWESKIGRRIAVSLVLLEIKRFFLLALEMIIEFPVLQFSGAIKSVIFSFADVALGVPCALMAISSIRKRQEQSHYSKVKILLKCVVLIIVVCVVLNIMTLASIGYHVNVKQSTIKDIFNSTMRLYLTDNYYKYNLDEIQFELQCCGHTTYTDWFLFDWKKSERGTRKKKNLRAINPDKEFGDLPFSCCNIHALLPCVHMQMTEADVKMVNNNGCSKILSHILIRIVVFGYVITALAIFVYIILIYFLVKIVRKPLPRDCPSDCSCLSSEDSSPRCPLIQQSSPCSCSSSSSSLSVGNEICPISKRNSKILETLRKSSFYWRNDSFDKRKRARKSSNSSLEESSICMNREIARIIPSAHEQHEISQKSSKSSMTVFQ